MVVFFPQIRKFLNAIGVLSAAAGFAVQGFTKPMQMICATKPQWSVASNVKADVHFAHLLNLFKYYLFFMVFVLKIQSFLVLTFFIFAS